MFFRNNTQLFMEAKFTTEEDYKFLDKLARETGSGEQAWRKAGVDRRDDKQHRLLEKRKKRQEQVQKNAEQIAGIAIILDKGIVSNLKHNHLLDQIEIFKEAGAPNLHSNRPGTLLSHAASCLSHPGSFSSHLGSFPLHPYTFPDPGTHPAT